MDLVLEIGLLSVPSYATLLTLKRSIEQRGNVCPLTQKNLVQLDWVSKEDGSHILTVGVSVNFFVFLFFCFDKIFRLTLNILCRLGTECYSTQPFPAQL